MLNEPKKRRTNIRRCVWTQQKEFGTFWKKVVSLALWPSSIGALEVFGLMSTLVCSASRSCKALQLLIAEVQRFTTWNIRLTDNSLKYICLVFAFEESWLFAPVQWSRILIMGENDENRLNENILLDFSRLIVFISLENALICENYGPGSMSGHLVELCNMASNQNMELLQSNLDNLAEKPCHRFDWSLHCLISETCGLPSHSAATLFYNYIILPNVRCIQLQKRFGCWIKSVKISAARLRNVRCSKHLKQPAQTVGRGNRYDGNKFHSCDGWDQNQGAGRTLSSHVVCEHQWFLSVMQNHFGIPSQISCEPAPGIFKDISWFVGISSKFSLLILEGWRCGLKVFNQVPETQFLKRCKWGKLNSVNLFPENWFKWWKSGRTSSLKC